MKYPTCIISAILIAITMFSCKKDAPSSSKGSVSQEKQDSSTVALGKWNITLDSAEYAPGEKVFYTVYRGETGDYWDFRSDSKVYVKEGAKLDTFDYHVLSDTTITIARFGVTINGVTQISQIKVLTQNNLFIYAPLLPISAGAGTRTLTLYK